MKKIYTAGLFFAAALSVNAQQLVTTLTTAQPSKAELADAWKKHETKTKKKGLSNTKAGAILLEEDFETQEIPATWTLSEAAGSEGWIADTTDATATWSPTETSPLAAFGILNWFAVSNDAKFDDGSNSNDASADYLEAPAMDFTSISAALFVLDFYFNPTKTFSTASIEVSIDAGSSWTSIYTVTGDAEWQTGVEIDLTAYAGEADVRLRFGHNDNGNAATGFAIDNLLVQEIVVDLQLSVAGNIYSMLPQNHATSLELTAFVSNIEFGDATGVVLEGTVTDPSSATTDLLGNIPAIIEGQTDTNGLVTPDVTTSALGTHTYDLTVTSSEADETPADNQVTFDVQVNDTIYARNNGVINASYGIGDGVEYLGWPFFGGAETGSIFTFATDDSITAVEFAFGADAAAGDEIEINFYGISGGVLDINSPIASTASVIKTTPIGTSEIVTVEVIGGYYDPIPGEQLFAAATLVNSATGNSFIGGDSLDIVTGFSGSYMTGQIGLFAEGFYGGTCNPYIRLILGEFDPSTAKPDLTISANNTDLEYASTPLVQVKPINFEIDIENKGAGAADDVEAVVTVLADGASVYTNQSSLGTLAGGEVSTNIDLGTFTPSAIGTYQVVLDVNTSTTEDNVANNTDTLVFFVSDSLYNRAAVSLDGLFNFGPNLDVGTGTPDDVTFGSTYELVTPDTITAVSFVTAGDQQVGDEFIVNVYDGAGSPVGNSDVFTVATAGTPNTPSVITLTFGNGLALPVGSYYLEFEAVSTADNQPRTFYMASSIATENTAFITLINQAAEFDIATAFGEPFTPIVEVVLGNAQVVGINEVSKLEVSIYPNPVQDFIKVTNADNSNYAIYNVTGRKVASGKVVNKNTKINTADFNTGIYFIEFTGAVNETVKIVKN